MGAADVENQDASGGGAPRPATTRVASTSDATAFGASRADALVRLPCAPGGASGSFLFGCHRVIVTVIKRFSHFRRMP
jgi:hypothetical protein